MKNDVNSIENSGESTAIVVNIQRFTIHDGPESEQNYFLKAVR